MTGGEKISKKAPAQPRLDKRSLDIDSGWEDIAPAVVFNNFTHTQLHDKRLNVFALRDQLKAAEQSVKNLRASVDNAELDLWTTCGLVIDGVIGAPGYGRNSPLYASFGLIPASQRASGLTRKKDAAKAKQMAQAAQALKQPTIELPLLSSNGYTNGHALSNGR